MFFISNIRPNSLVFQPITWLGFFQQLCGFEYTSKLQRMFQDMNVSRDLNDHFKKHLAATEPLDSKFMHCFMYNCSSNKHHAFLKYVCTVNAGLSLTFECAPTNFDK